MERNVKTKHTSDWLAFCCWLISLLQWVKNQIKQPQFKEKYIEKRSVFIAVVGETKTFFFDIKKESNNQTRTPTCYYIFCQDGCFFLFPKKYYEIKKNIYILCMYKFCVCFIIIRSFVIYIHTYYVHNTHFRRNNLYVRILWD